MSEILAALRSARMSGPPAVEALRRGLYSPAVAERERSEGRLRLPRRGRGNAGGRLAEAEHDVPDGPGGRTPLPSLLPRGLRRYLALGLILAAFLLANTAYLVVHRLLEPGAAAEIVSPLLQTMVLAHTGVGLLLVLLLAGFVLAHLPKVWRRRHGESLLSGGLVVAVGLGLAVTGLFVLTEAASRQNRWAWWLHLGLAGVAPLAYWLHRRSSAVPPQPGRLRGFVLAVVLILGALGVAHGVLWRQASARGLADSPPAYDGLDPLMAAASDSAEARSPPEFPAGFRPAAWVPPSVPFFPSGASTLSGDRAPPEAITGGDVPPPERVAAELARYGRLQEASVGARSCAGCHPDVVASWEASAHRFASFNNPFYAATVDDMRARSRETNPWVEAYLARHRIPGSDPARVKSQWCAGCHDPALLFPGTMAGEMNRATAEAQAGLTCLACHGIEAIEGQTGNGNYRIREASQDPYIFAAASPGTLGAFLHDAALRARPEAHRRQMLKPFFRRSEFCAACHKVSLPAPVNNYRWLRGQNEYDAWHDSGVSLNASRTFYLPPRRRVCQECHMPAEAAPGGDVAAREGEIRSHRFPAANTALPFLRGDTASVRRIEAFLRDDKLRVDLFALSPAGGPLRLAIDRERPTLPAGQRVTVDVVVRNRGVGHTFPGGTNDSNEGWLEFSVLGPDGDLLGQSGWVGPDRHLDPMAHRYGAVLLDRHGEPIERRNAQEIFVTVYANMIGPGTADLAHYVFVVPPGLAGREITLKARLLWRKFTRPYTEFAFRAGREGFRDFEDVPDLPITEIAAHEVTLPVAGGGAADGGRSGRFGDAGAGGAVGPTGDGEDEWIRYNDYGIGLLLEGNTRDAALAFSRVAELEPGRVDGPLNLARVAVQDGNLAEAYRQLRLAERVRPADARVAWVWGNARQEEGRYEEAAAAYGRVLEEFPEDRAAWRNLGRTLYLAGRQQEALDALDRVLAIDPEDRVAHYHRMLALRALGREREAAAAEAAYRYYQVDETAQAVTREFRLRNPGANLMSQPVRTHRVEVAMLGSSR